jgi:hypothetical protein
VSTENLAAFIDGDLDVARVDAQLRELGIIVREAISATNHAGPIRGARDATRGLLANVTRSTRRHHWTTSGVVAAHSAVVPWSWFVRGHGVASRRGISSGPMHTARRLIPPVSSH